MSDVQPPKSRSFIQCLDVPTALFSFILLVVGLAFIWGQIPIWIGGPALIAFGVLAKRQIKKRRNERVHASSGQS